ncbi:ribose ABC transporter permease, partial [Photorhabdus asymbiotica]
MNPNASLTPKRWFTKEWLLPQKSLIALLVLIIVVSS